MSNKFLLYGTNNVEKRDTKSKKIKLTLEMYFLSMNSQSTAKKVLIFTKINILRITVM